MTTIHYKGFDFECKVYHQPEERQTHDYPGCGEEFEFTNITLNGIDASELLENQWDEFEEEAIRQLKDY
jgi:hypothetical protein